MKRETRAGLTFALTMLMMPPLVMVVLAVGPTLAVRIWASLGVVWVCWLTSREMTR